MDTRAYAHSNAHSDVVVVVVWAGLACVCVCVCLRLTKGVDPHGTIMMGAQSRRFCMYMCREKYGSKRAIFRYHRHTHDRAHTHTHTQFVRPGDRRRLPVERVYPIICGIDDKACALLLRGDHDGDYVDDANDV